MAARSLSECLLIQAQDLSEKNSLVETLIENYLDRLEDRYLPKVARDLKITLEEVLDALRIIKEFNPKPGNAFNSEAIDYVAPDLIVIKTDNGYDVSLNDDGVPDIKINAFYQNLLNLLFIYSFSMIILVLIQLREILL